MTHSPRPTTGARQSLLARGGCEGFLVSNDSFGTSQVPNESFETPSQVVTMPRMRREATLPGPVAGRHERVVHDIASTLRPAPTRAARPPPGRAGFSPAGKGPVRKPA